MTIEFFLIVLFIALPVSLFFNYKFASQLTNAYLFRKLAGYGILVVLSVAEYFYFGSLAMGIIFTSFVAWELLKSFCLLSILIFIVVAGKVSEKDSKIYKLLFTHMTMRNLLQKQNANIYFFKKNGVNIYFDSASDHFQSLTDYSLQRLKIGISLEDSKTLSLENFLVLQCDDNYISVSSDDLSLLDIDMFNMDRNHFDVLRMLKI